MSNILLVDDEKMAQWVGKKTLEQPPTKHAVDIASTGEEAVKMATSGKYQVVFMDVGLPPPYGPEGGMRATKEIREYEKNNHLEPVIIIGLSANQADEMEQKMLDAGADAYLVKPVSKEKYEEVISEQLEGRISRGPTTSP